MSGISFHMLLSEFLLEILSESTGFVGIWVVQGCKGVGDIPGIQGDSRGIGMFQVTLLD